MSLPDLKFFTTRLDPCLRLFSIISHFVVFRAENFNSFLERIIIAIFAGRIDT
jgi:hypothetical protein